MQNTTVYVECLLRARSGHAEAWAMYVKVNHEVTKLCYCGDEVECD